MYVHETSPCSGPRKNNLLRMISQQRYIAVMGISEQSTALCINFQKTQVYKLYREEII